MKILSNSGNDVSFGNKSTWKTLKLKSASWCFFADLERILLKQWIWFQIFLYVSQFDRETIVFKENDEKKYWFSSLLWSWSFLLKMCWGEKCRDTIFDVYLSQPESSTLCICMWIKGGLEITNSNSFQKR